MSNEQRTIFRNACPTVPYTQICNETLRSTEMSLEAKGLHVSVLALPPYWEFSKRWAMKHYKIGETKVERILRELIKLRLCEKIQDRSNKGMFGDVLYRFTDIPGVFAENNRAVEITPADDEDPYSPRRGKPGGGSPRRGNHPPIEKNESINQLSEKIMMPNKPETAYSPSSSPSPKAALSVEAKEIKAAQKTAKAERRGKSQPDLIDMPDTSNAAKEAERAFEDAVVQRFNAIAVPHKIAPVVRLTAQRRQTLRVLIKSGFDVNAALDALGRASFPTKNGWTPENFDAVFREQTITQLLEGKFAAHIVSFEDEQVKRWRQRIKAWIDRGRVHWPETWGRMCDIPAEIQREFPNEVFGSAESVNLTKNGGVK
jgi:hypothetical protein